MNNPQTAVEATILAQELKALHARIAPRFTRAEPRKRVLAYLQGLLSSVERKNGWQLAEEAGESTPDGMQRLLSTAQWDADAVRDDLVTYVAERLADPDAILVIDEIGFLKKGTRSAGVKRQYTGTTNHKENCQVGVFLGYSLPGMHVLIDRELYLPKEWLDDRSRCREAAIPDEKTYATKPELARQMLDHLGTTRLPFRWIVGGTGYGGSRDLREWLESQQLAYILALAVNDEVDTLSNETQHLSVQEIVANVNTQWDRLDTPNEAGGSRSYDWALIPLASPGCAGWDRRLLIRRSLEDEQQMACYLIFAPGATQLETIVNVVGRLRKADESLQIAKQEVGLDHYEVRHWVGWYRHITLAMLAMASLAVVHSQLASNTGKRTSGNRPFAREGPGSPMAVYQLMKQALSLGKGSLQIALPQ